MTQYIRRSLLASLLGLLCIPAMAQDLGPPTAPANGAAILDLSGSLTGQAAQPANILVYDTDPNSPNYGTCVGGTCSPTQYTASFTTPGSIAGPATITFAFRNDPGFFGFSNVVLSSGGGPNLILDGDFSDPNAILNNTYDPANVTSGNCGGTYVWCGYNQLPGIASGGAVANPQTPVPGSPSGLNWPSGGYFWVDGATQQYDGIYQNVSLAPDTTYQLSFNLENITSNNSLYPLTGQGIVNGCGTGDNPGFSDYSTYSATTTNSDKSDICGNSANVVAYVGYPGLPTPDGGFEPLGTPPAGVPEPTSLALLGSGLFGFGAARRWRRK